MRIMTCVMSLALMVSQAAHAALPQDYQNYFSFALEQKNNQFAKVPNNGLVFKDNKTNGVVSYGRYVQPNVDLQLSYALDHQHKNNNKVVRGFFTTQANSAKASLDKFNIGLNFTRPVENNTAMKLLAHVGMHNTVLRYKNEVVINNAVQQDTKFTKIGISPRIGAGVEYDLNEKLFIRALAIYENRGSVAKVYQPLNSQTGRVKDGILASLGLGLRF